MRTKKILSFMLAIVMVASMMAAMGISASAAKLYSCRVGEVCYATVDAARHNAESGSTIVLLHDISEDLYFEYGDEFTVDLNGYGIVNNVATNKTIHNNEGTLTIIDSNPTAEHYFNFVEDGAWTLIGNPTATQKESAVASYEADAEHPVVKICGGYVTGNGVLNTAGRLTIERANLVGNHHTDGALQNRNGEVTYKNGEIVGNTGAEGGAIVNRNGIMTVGVLNADNKNLIIAHNTALLYNGGAISTFVNVVDQENDCRGSQLTLNSGYIANNKANEKGGAIANSITYTDSELSVAAFKMYGGIIENNEAGLNGGGVSNFASGSNGSAIFELYNGSIIGNKCVNRTAQDKGGNGGGVANTGDFRMYGGVIAENQANLGGGVYNAHLFTMTNGEIKENKAVLSPNNPQANGLIGGLYNDGNLGLGAVSVLYGGSVKDNTAVRMVGGIFNEYGILVLSGATVTGNKSPYVGGIAQFGVMAVGGNTVIDGNLEGTKASNLLLADMSALSGKQPLILGDGTEKTLAEGVAITLPALATTAKIGVTYAATLNTTTYAFTKGAGRLTDAGTAAQIANFTSDYDLTNINYHANGYLELIANVAYLDLDSTTTDTKDSKDLEQKYSLTVEESDYTDVTKVKVEWTITDITATRKDAKKWNPDTLTWVDDNANDVISADAVTATFKITNYSSVEVDAKVEFEAAEYETGKKFNPTVVYTGVDATNHKTTLDTVVGENHAVAANSTAPSATVTVKVTPGADDFKTISAATIEKYGTYTVTIEEHEDGDCLAKGTKITMADGTLKNVEDVVEGDAVLTYNHEAGRFEAQKVYLAWAGKTPKRAFTLHFTNDVDVSVVGDHCFFEKESLSYVAIFENTAENFIGKHFYNATAGRYEELLSVTYENTPVDYYEIYTEYNANCIAENMLNVAYDSSEMLNIYKFNEDLTIDREQLASDVAEFGIFEYVENERYSEELYDALGWKYLYVMVGKNFGTMEEFHARADAFLAEEY